MSLTSEPRSAYWTEHFNELAKSETTSAQLDFSNHALIVQNYAFILEACGAIANKRVLDAGFGTGDLACMMDRLGADVTAFDVVTTRIAQLRVEAPTIAWWHDDISTWKQPRAAERFDIVVACETLQYVEFNSAIRRFLNVMTDSGRIVILIPNADCPIVQRVSQRFENKYVGISMKSLPHRLRSLGTNLCVTYRGIYFQDDQSLGPYRSGPWQQVRSGNVPEARKHDDQPRPPHFRTGMPSAIAETANRIQIIVSRSAKPGGPAPTFPPTISQRAT